MFCVCVAFVLRLCCVCVAFVLRLCCDCVAIVLCQVTMATQREWFTSFYAGQKSHAEVEELAKKREVVAIIEFSDWKTRRMPDNPDFGTRNRSVHYISIH